MKDGCSCKYRDIGSIVVRWVLGILFIQMGLAKALEPVEFLKLVRQYDLTTSHLLLNSIASALPWFEIICGVLLVLGVAVRGNALVLLGMLLPFTIVVVRRALAIASAQDLAFCAVKFDCGCGQGEVYICRKIVENAALMLGAVWLLRGYGRRLSLRYSLFREGQQSPPPAPGAALAAG